SFATRRSSELSVDTSKPIVPLEKIERPFASGLKLRLKNSIVPDESPSLSPSPFKKVEIPKTEKFNLFVVCNLSLNLIQPLVISVSTSWFLFSLRSEERRVGNQYIIDD